MFDDIIYGMLTKRVRPFNFYGQLWFFHQTKNFVTFEKKKIRLPVFLHENSVLLLLQILPKFFGQIIIIYFFYLSGQLFFSIHFGDRNYNKTYTLPLKVKWPYPNKKCWFIIYSVSLGPFRNKVGLI